MLNKYQIVGLDKTGRRVNETVEAMSEKHALSIIYDRYGKLTELDISQISFLVASVGNILEVQKFYKSSPYADSEIIEMMIRIKADQGSQDDYMAVKEHFSPIINAAVKDYRYRDLSDVEQEDYKEQLTRDIISEFAPKFSADRGQLLSYIKLKVRDRMYKYYDRKINVNSNNREKKRLRTEAIKEYYELSFLPQQDIDLDIAQANLVRAIQRIGNMDLKEISRKLIEDTHERIVELGMHHLLDFEQQRNVYTLAYGQNRLKQRDIAERLNTSQPNVSITLNRAKKNIWEKIIKINLEAK
ncbi:hypothetical protein [Paenibacillus glucanolyticus]|uniref:hypothetical protein n=1 Tax=Paenibacillus glucanolyticus TaxID=59843 RepID=UPI0034D01E9C